MDAVAACRMLVSHNWYDCSNSMDIDGSDKSLKRCQFALWKFQRGMWVLVGGSEPRIAIWTIEWSLPVNSLWTVALHLNATSAETIDKSKTLHSYRPLRQGFSNFWCYRAHEQIDHNLRSPTISTLLLSNCINPVIASLDSCKISQVSILISKWIARGALRFLSRSPGALYGALWEPMIYATLMLKTCLCDVIMVILQWKEL